MSWRRFLRWLRGRRLPDPPIPDPEPTDWSILSEINRFRAQNGRRPLLQSDCLTSQAERHAAKLRQNKDPHDGWQERLAACGFSRGSENVAWGHQSDAECVAHWMDSKGHRANILGDWDVCGTGQQGVYRCAIFADE